MRAILVRELNPPTLREPIYWVLLTNLPVTNLDEARKIIGYYELRWLIEEYHKALKTGCGIERHALRESPRLEPLIGLISVVAARLLQMKTLGQHDPQALAYGRVPLLVVTHSFHSYV